MRTTGSCDQRVKFIVHERDVCNSANEAADGRAGLAGRKMVNDGRNNSVGIDFRDARGETASVRTRSGRSLVTNTDSREIATCAALGDIKITVRLLETSARADC